MSRVISYDNSIEKYINGCKQPRTGVILGQSFDQRTYLLSVIPTPPNSTSNKSTSSSSPNWSSSTTIGWISEHARQVQRMSTGGIYVIGIFLVETEKTLKQLENDGTIRELIYSLPSSPIITEHFLIRSLVQSNQIFCDYYTGTRKEPAKPKLTTLRTQAIHSSLITFSCTYPLTFTFFTDKTDLTSESLSTNIYKALPSFESLFTSSLPVVDSQRFDSSLTLEKLFITPVNKNEKSKGKSTVGKKVKEEEKEVSSETHHITFYTPLIRNIIFPTDDHKPSSSLSITLTGNIHSLTYSHKKNTLAQTISLVQADIINSLRSRISLLIEDAEDVHGSLDIPLDTSIHTFNLPIRIFFPILSSSFITLSDYLLSHESNQDSIVRAKELLDCTIAYEDIISIEKAVVKPPPSPSSVRQIQVNAVMEQITASSPTLQAIATALSPPHTNTPNSPHQTFSPLPPPFSIPQSSLSSNKITNMFPFLFGLLAILIGLGFFLVRSFSDG